MGSPVTLPALIALALGGSGLGVYLGKSAIGQINPIHYGSLSSASTFHADLVASPADYERAPVTAAQFDTFAGLGTGCVRCAAAPEEYVAIDPAVGRDDYQGPATVTADTLIEGVDRDLEAAAAAARRAAVAERVERYAHYPVSAEEAEVKLATAEAEPAELEQAECGSEDQCGGEDSPAI